MGIFIYFQRPAIKKRKGGFATALGAFGSRARSDVDDGDNRHASGVHKDKFLLVNEVPQSAPRRINLDQCQGNRDDANAGARNNRAYGDVEVNVTDARSAVRGAMSPEALRPQIRTQLVVARDALDCNARMRSASVPLPGCSEPTLAPGPPAGP